MITVDTTSNPSLPVTTLRGRYGPPVNKVFVDGTEVVSANGEWSTTVKLQPGRNTFEVVGRGKGKTATQIVVLHLQETNSRVRNLHNVFDDWGIELNLKRRRGEKNQSYKKRLLRAAEHRFGVNKRFASQYISTGLSLHSTLSRFVLYAVRSSDSGQPYINDLTFRCDDSRVYFDSSKFNRSDVVLVDPIQLTAYLPEKCVAVDQIYSGGEPIPRRDYVFDDHYNRVVFTDRRYAARRVKVQYRYSKTVEYRHLSLGAFKSAVNGLTHNGDRFVDCLDGNIPAGLEDYKSAASLIQQEGPAGVGPRSRVPDDFGFQGGLPVGAAKVRVRTLADSKGFYLNPRGAAYDAPLGGWHKTLTKNSRLTWGQFVPDRSYWYTISSMPHMNYFPHLTDQERGYWLSSTNQKLTLTDLRRLGVGTEARTYKGVTGWLSGVGTQGDLYTSITELSKLSMHQEFLKADLAKSAGWINLNSQTNIQPVVEVQE